MTSSLLQRPAMRRVVACTLAFIGIACVDGTRHGRDGGGDPDANAPTGAPDSGTDPDGAVSPPASDGLFSTPMPWTRTIFDAPVSAESDAIIAALDQAGGWGTGDFRIDFSITILGAAASTPRMTFIPKDEDWAEANLGDSSLAEFYRPDCDEVPFPVPPSGAIEGEAGYACESDGDCHLIVIERDERRLYEMWRADLRDGVLLGGCAAVWDLDHAYDPDTLRGRGCTSADAGGFPLTAMLPTVDEVVAGEVRHALRFILPNSRIRDGIYVPPATHSTFPTSGGPDLPPYGVRFRLRADFDESQLPSDGARVIARALKQYGMFLADGGNLPLTFASDRGSSFTWEDVGLGPRSLEAIQVTDFEVVEYRDPVDWNSDTTCHRN